MKVKSVDSCEDLCIGTFLLPIREKVYLVLRTKGLRAICGDVVITFLLACHLIGGAGCAHVRFCLPNLEHIGVYSWGSTMMAFSNPSYLLGPLLQTRS